MFDEHFKPLVVPIFGAVTTTASYLTRFNDWVTLIAGLLTVVYTALKIFDWLAAKFNKTRTSRSK